MKSEFRAHPFMIFSIIRPFLIVLIVPVIKGIIQYIFEKKVTGVLGWEITVFIAMSLIAAIRCYSFRLIYESNYVIIKMGILFHSKSVINIKKLSSVQMVQNPLDAVFNSVTFRINTEAGQKNKSDFEFKLSKKESERLSSLLYGKSNTAAVKFSIIKVAVMAATTSSAVTGMIIGVPVLNKAGKLLNLALDEMLLDEINNVSSSIQTYFPPIVNVISLLFLLGYGVSFLYSLLRYINFKLFLGNDKLEVRSGFFVRTQTSFKKNSVNNVRIDQTPLMHLFKRYAMKVSVGGYGDSKSESAVIVPSGRRGEIKRQFSIYFSFLEPKGQMLHAKRDIKTKNRFLFWPAVFFLITVAVSTVLSLIFKRFSRLILFLTVVICCIILYYARLCIFEFKLGKIRIGNNIFAQSVKGFRTCELYCPKENVGEIKIVRYLPDIKYNTCNVTINVRSESADNIKVRHLDYSKIIDYIKICYQFDE